MRTTSFSSLIGILLFLSACAGKFQYYPPDTEPPSQNSIVIDLSKDELWNKAIPALAKGFFVINNLDKDSGIINVSYSGNPEKYVDCGQVESYVKNARGARTYKFSASSAQQSYEVMDMKYGAGLLFFSRKMDLEGRINIIVEEFTAKRSRVTINAKYVLTKSMTARNTQGAVSNFSDTISFVSGQQARFPSGNAFAGTLCQPSGNLEEEILEVFKGLAQTNLK